MTQEMKRRALKTIKTFAMLIGIGLVYALFYMITGIGIPCMFRVITGFQCPGCGVTHMCIALLKLDFQTAWESNPAIFSLLPVGGLMFVYTIYFYIKFGKWPRSRWYNILIGIMIVVLVVFGVWRNEEQIMQIIGYVLPGTEFGYSNLPVRGNRP